MSKRSDALAHIKIAGYHDDHRAAMRLYVENRISRQAYEEAFASGVKAKQAGVPCACPACNRPKITAKGRIERAQ